MACSLWEVPTMFTWSIRIPFRVYDSCLMFYFSPSSPILPVFSILARCFMTRVICISYPFDRIAPDTYLLWGDVVKRMAYSRFRSVEYRTSMLCSRWKRGLAWWTSPRWTPIAVCWSTAVRSRAGPRSATTTGQSILNSAASSDCSSATVTDRSDSWSIWNNKFANNYML